MVGGCQLLPSSTTGRAALLCRPKGSSFSGAPQTPQATRIDLTWFHLSTQGCSNSSLSWLTQGAWAPRFECFGPACAFWRGPRLLFLRAKLLSLPAGHLSAIFTLQFFLTSLCQRIVGMGRGHVSSSSGSSAKLIWTAALGAGVQGWTRRLPQSHAVCFRELQAGMNGPG